MTKLIIVESPTKAKTIKKFLGSGYTVLSSFGHVRDLPKSTMGVDIEHNFEPKYIVPIKAKEQVKKLQATAKKAEEIILASDEDREGEAIAWHLAFVLGLFNTKGEIKRGKTIKRIVFHEITKRAITEALKHPRDIDLNLVNAQQARRVLDRLVGYELSPFLWKKIKRGLSAGRVQSVALRFIVQREKEREKFSCENFYTISANIKKDDDSPVFQTDLTHIDNNSILEKKKFSLFAGDYTVSSTTLRDEEQVNAIVRDLKLSRFAVDRIEKRSLRRSPLAPFTTSTLQQSSINVLGFSSKQTMMIAQKLYEEGFITYMRTDSTNLSADSLSEAREYIKGTFGEKYLPEHSRVYAKKSKGAQEAHEAIRPTHPTMSPEKLAPELDPQMFKLYRLIWNRMIASQMTDAELSSTRVLVIADGKKHSYTLTAQGSIVVFDGHLVLGKGTKQLEDELPELAEKDPLTCVSVNPLAKETSAPPRYTEASLVKILEERGIGRPSTYAPTISTIFAREYIARDDAKRLYPLEIGIIVSDLLVEHFPQIVDDGFTSIMEQSFDDVAEGKMQWQPVIKQFYEPFHENLEKKKKEIKKEDILESVGRECPQCKKDLIYRYGRFGKFISCSGYPECKYTEKTENDKALEEEHSDEKCDKCGAPMLVKHGRFGAFLGCSKYPECKGIKRIEKTTGVHCPNCEKGQIVERKSKKGRAFYGCDQYPKCKTAFWSKPTGDKCPKCQSLVVFAAKGTTACSNKECGYKV
jgi:DNA topoisomerase I